MTRMIFRVWFESSNFHPKDSKDGVTFFKTLSQSHVHPNPNRESYKIHKASFRLIQASKRVQVQAAQIHRFGTQILGDDVTFLSGENKNGKANPS